MIGWVGRLQRGSRDRELERWSRSEKRRRSEGEKDGKACKGVDS